MNRDPKNNETIGNSNQFSALRDFLEGFGYPWRDFLNLRSDSYEHALAAQSVQQLAAFYAILLKPGLTLQQAQAQCPPWPAGFKHAGKLPSLYILSQVGTRLRSLEISDPIAVLVRQVANLKP